MAKSRIRHPWLMRLVGARNIPAPNKSVSARATWRSGTPSGLATRIFALRFDQIWAHLCSPKPQKLTTVRRKTTPDFLVENMIDLDKQFLNPAPKTPAVRGGRREERRMKEEIDV